MKKSIYIFFIPFLLLFQIGVWAQDPSQGPTEKSMENIEGVEDDFQEYFFEALKQKAIENYELALTALRQAEKATEDNERKAVVYFEMGKNYLYLKDYLQAEENYKRVLAMVGDRLDVLEHLYDVYYRQNDYEKAIPTVKKLILFDEDYKEDLANLYVHIQQYDSALELLDELESSWGQSDIRNALRARIYKITGNTQGAIDDLEQRVVDNPKNEKEYLNLIFLYSEQGETEKAFETAKSLLESNPNSKLVHLALYKFYLSENESEKAIASMKIVFSADEVDRDTKYRVLSDFIRFVDENPDHEEELADVVDLFSEKHSGIYKQLGDYYLSKGKKENALAFYQEGNAKDFENYYLLTNTLLLQIDFLKFDEAEELSSRALEIFPAQALLYLLNGVSNNGLNQSKKAISTLETGLDFVFDDPKMERDFYTQLSLAYSKIGNSDKADTYAKKAKGIKIN